jgi:hypothetical protein
MGVSMQMKFVAGDLVGGRLSKSEIIDALNTVRLDKLYKNKRSKDDSSDFSFDTANERTSFLAAMAKPIPMIHALLSGKSEIDPEVARIAMEACFSNAQEISPNTFVVNEGKDLCILLGKSKMEEVLEMVL